MGGLQCYCKYFAIFKSCIFTLDHFPILTQPSRLSVFVLRSFKSLFSNPLKKKRCRLIILRLFLPERLSEDTRLIAGIFCPPEPLSGYGRYVGSETTSNLKIRLHPWSIKWKMCWCQQKKERLTMRLQLSSIMWLPRLPLFYLVLSSSNRLNSPLVKDARAPEKPLTEK